MTIVCIATGPSVTAEQVEIAKRYRLFACNNAFLLAPDCELLYGCNYRWWEAYWDRVRDLPCEKWTSNELAAKQFGVNHIREEWGEGLCDKPDTIFHGHGSGYSLIGMAHKKGATRILLLGYDMKYPEGYDGHQKVAGGDRHFFGEYPKELQHWPKNPWSDLIPLYKAVRDQGMDLISCTPNSALNDVLPYMDIADAV